MSIQNSQGEKIPLAKVAELPVQTEGDGETAQEILDSIPDVPVCVKCKRRAFEVNADGFCNVCQPPLPRVTENSAPMVVRPSLNVETEVNRNLRPRLVAHLGRMRAWDLRSLPVEDQGSFSGALLNLDVSFAQVERWLDKLASSGFVAKTTPVTRIASKLDRGTPVSLRDDKLAEFASVYTAEQLGSLSVGRITPTHVQLFTGDGESIGLVKIIHVELKS